MKQCKTCNKDKDISKYPKDKRSPVGHSGRNCSDCVNKKHRLINNKVSVTEKKCGTCELTKSASEFQRDKKGSGGLQANCKDCRNAKKRKDWNENKEHNSKARKEYRERNVELVREWKKRSYERHRETILAQQKVYNENNKEARAIYRKKHYSENKHIYIANARKRASRLKEGINDNYTERMREIYYMSEAMCKEDNIKYQVDHIIPLTHKDVCGLHVPWNIQILTEDENRSKKNKFDGTYDNGTWR